MGTWYATYLIVLNRGKRAKVLVAMLLAFVLASALFNRANAQVGNASDWHVPPPLPPGNTTKGTTTGKPATVVLSLIDISSGGLPGTGAVRLPGLAPVSTTSPAVSTPDQPGAAVVITGIPSIPLPGAPDAPALPKQTMQDVPVTATADLPLVTAPEMPSLPSEPNPTGQTATTGQKGLPLMPFITAAQAPVLPINKNPIVWPTPAIIENESLKPVPEVKQN